MHASPQHTPHLVTKTEPWYRGTTSKQVFFAQLGGIVTIIYDIAYFPFSQKCVDEEDSIFIAETRIVDTLIKVVRVILAEKF